MPYAPTVTLAPTAYPVPRTEILFSTVHPDAVTATVYRNSGGRSMRVRSGVNIAALGGFSLVDNEAPFVDSFTYSAEMFGLSGNSLGFTDPSEVATLGATGTVLHSPTDSSRFVVVQVLDETARSLKRPFRGGFVYAIGRTTPAWVGSGRSGLTDLELSVMTTGGGTDALRAMFGEYLDTQMPTIVFRSSLPLGVPGTLFLGVPEPEFRYLVNDPDGAAVWRLVGNEISPPAESIGRSPLTYGDLESFFALYSELEGAKGTYLGLESFYDIVGADPTQNPQAVLVAAVGIPSGEAIGVPNLSGVVVPVGIESAETFGVVAAGNVGDQLLPSTTTYPSTTLYPRVGPFTWSGYEWNLKDSGGALVGPGPNRFAEGGVSLSGGNLTLNLRNVGGTWYSSEVYSTASLGYGKYEWVWETSKHPSTWDKNPVLGMFLYSFDQQGGVEPEIDWELSQFGDVTSARLWSSVHPATIPSSTEGQGAYAGIVGPYTSTFWWQAGLVYFRTTDANGVVIGENQSVKLVPTEGTEKVRMNLWAVLGNAPTDALDYQVTLRSFAFTENATQSNPLAHLRTTNTLDTPHNLMLFGPTTEVSSGLLKLPMRLDYGNSARTGMVFNLNGSYVDIELATVPAGVGEESEIQLRYDANELFAFIKSGTSLLMVHRVAGVNSNTSITWDGVAHKFWRFGNVTGTSFTYETSPDGTTWTVRRTVTTALTTAQRSGMQLNFIAGSFQAEVPPGVFEITAF